MVKPLAFKGDAPAKKKRKRAKDPNDAADGEPDPSTHPTGAADDDDAWVAADAASDLSGPILLVLPPPPTPLKTEEGSAPLTCVACDANGAVFGSALEEPAADGGAAAEPHDVRQVWVANRVAGTDEGVVSLKGHHGR